MKNKEIWISQKDKLENKLENEIRTLLGFLTQEMIRWKDIREIKETNYSSDTITQINEIKRMK